MIQLVKGSNAGCMVDDAGALPGILEETRNLVIWKRPPNPRVERWVSLWLSRIDLEIDRTIHPDHDVTDELVHDLCAAGCPPGAGMCDFAIDITFLAGAFARIAGLEQARVRLETLRDDGCTKFHVDSLRLRMLCTYAGPGTEWVPDKYANRRELGINAETMEKANRRIVPDPSHVQVTPTGAVMIFKGSGYDNRPHTGLVHRSHPVRHAGEIRLRLCIDEPDSGY